MLQIVLFFISILLSNTMHTMEQSTLIPQITQSNPIVELQNNKEETLQIYSQRAPENTPPSTISIAAIKYSLTMTTILEVSENKDHIYIDFPQEHIECIVQLLQQIEMHRTSRNSMPSIHVCKQWIIDYTEHFNRMSFADMLKITLFLDIRILFDALLEIEHPIPLPHNHLEEIAYNKQLLLILKIAHQISTQKHQIENNAFWGLLGRMLYPGCVHYPKIRHYIEIITGKYINPAFEKISSMPHLSKDRRNTFSEIEEIVLETYMQQHPHLYNNHLRMYNKNIDDIKTIIHCLQSNQVIIATKNIIQKIDIKKNKRIYSKIIPDYINVAALSAHGEYSATVLGFNDSIKIAHIQSEITKELKGHTDPIAALSFSPNTHLLASGSWDNTVRVWNIKDKVPLLCTFTGHTDTIDSLAFHPNNKILASGSRDNTVRIWDTESKKCIAVLPCPDFVYALTFNHTGSTLAAGCEDGSIILWDVIDGSIIQHIKTHPDHTDHPEHPDRITSVAFSPNDNLIASGSYDRTIRLYEVSTGKICQTINAHNDYVSSITFNPHGTCIISGGWDNIIQIYGQTSLLQALTDSQETSDVSAAPSAHHTHS